MFTETRRLARIVQKLWLPSALAARGKSPDRPCARDLASAGKARGGGDARASSTTSNAVRRRQTPGALRVAGGADPSALLRLLDDAWASPASPRLVSGPAAPATRPIRLLPRAASPHYSQMLCCSSAIIRAEALRFLALLGVLHEYACGARRRPPCQPGACATSRKGLVNNAG